MASSRLYDSVNLMFEFNQIVECTINCCQCCISDITRGKSWSSQSLSYRISEGSSRSRTTPSSLSRNDPVTKERSRATRTGGPQKISHQNRSSSSPVPVSCICRGLLGLCFSLRRWECLDLWIQIRKAQANPVAQDPLSGSWLYGLERSLSNEWVDRQTNRHACEISLLLIRIYQA